MARFRSRTSQQQRRNRSVWVMDIIIHHWKVMILLICIILTSMYIILQQQISWNVNDDPRISSVLSLLPVVPVPVLIPVSNSHRMDDPSWSTTSNDTTTTATATATNIIPDHNDCFVHEPMYVTNVIRNPRRRRNENHTRITSTTSDGTSDTNNPHSDGAYVRHPNPQRCGTLRRTIWKTGYTIFDVSSNNITTTTTFGSENSPTSTVMNLAYEIEQRQSNCSLPVRLFHLDNQNGLGAHLHLWSQAYCNNDNNNNDIYNAVTGMSTTTTTIPQLYRIQTYNPHWLWRDQTYCRSHLDHPMASPWTCYFPKMEDRCPTNDDHQIMTFHDINPNRLPNVTSPYNNNDRCLPLRWPNTKKEKNRTKKQKPPNSEPDTPEEKDDAAIRSISNYISEYRAATTEYIFQSIHPMIVQEAERQIGLLFGNHPNNNHNHSYNHLDHDHHTETDTATTAPQEQPQFYADTRIMVPPDLITVHLRWGDKFFEMDLVSIEEYVRAILDMLEIIQDNHNDQIHSNNRSETNNEGYYYNPIDNTTRADIYLASEDPNAVSEFIQYTQQYYPNWNIYVDRTITELNDFRPNVGNRASWTTKNTNGRAGLIALGSLLVSMESRYYILTTGSNWSRIMNELRINVIQKRCCEKNHKNCTHMIDLRPGEW